QAEGLEQLHEAPSEINLAGVESVSRRSRERVMVAVPTFPHRWNGHDRHVVGLDHGTIDDPVLRASGVGKVGNKPVHGSAGSHSHAHAPGYPRHSTEQKET